MDGQKQSDSTTTDTERRSAVERYAPRVLWIYFLFETVRGGVFLIPQAGPTMEDLHPLERAGFLLLPYGLFAGVASIHVAHLRKSTDPGLLRRILTRAHIEWLLTVFFVGSGTIVTRPHW